MTWSILVVDDSVAARAQLRAAFEAKGARVIEAENGREGLWRARTEQVDVIFSDVHMPVMDGLHMIEELRKERAHATTPIFVLTSDTHAARAAEGRKAGANAWIVKPINPELLWKAVERALFGKALPTRTPDDAKAQPARPDAIVSVGEVRYL